MFFLTGSISGEYRFKSFSIFKPRYLNACYSSLLMVNFFPIWSITFLWNHSVPDQKRSSPWDDKVPCSILLLCQKKIASSYLLLTPPMFIISSFTLKYHCLGSSHNPHEKLCSAPKFYLYWLLWVASRTFFFQSVSHAKRLINIHAVGFSWLQDYQS